MPVSFQCWDLSHLKCDYSCINAQRIDSPQRSDRLLVQNAQSVSCLERQLYAAAAELSSHAGLKRPQSTRSRIAANDFEPGSAVFKALGGGRYAVVATWQCVPQQPAAAQLCKLSCRRIIRRRRQFHPGRDRCKGYVHAAPCHAQRSGLSIYNTCVATVLHVVTPTSVCALCSFSRMSPSRAGWPC